MSRDGSFVIKKNNFSFMTHILRQFYRTALECTRGNLNDNGFIYKNVIVFSPNCIIATRVL